MASGARRAAPVTAGSWAGSGVPGARDTRLQLEIPAHSRARVWFEAPGGTPACREDRGGKVLEEVRASRGEVVQTQGQVGSQSPRLARSVTS